MVVNGFGEEGDRTVLIVEKIWLGLLGPHCDWLR
jgi:hypothetical protein